MDKRITKYYTSTGKEKYKYLLYVGVDPITGRSIQIKKQGFTTEKEALNSYLTYELKVLNGEYKPIDYQHLTFVDVFQQWKEIYKNQVRESTLATTLRYFNDHILPVFRSLQVNKITVAYCQTVVNQWFKEAPKTFKRFIRYTNNVLDFAVKREIISKNPMLQVERPKIKSIQKKHTDFYSKSELLEYLECAKQYNFKYYVFFRLLGLSGMRKSEALALTWADIDFKNSTIKVNKAINQGLNNRIYVFSPKNASSIRDIPLDQETIIILKRWQAIERKTMFSLGFNINNKSLVFPSTNNTIIRPTQPTQWNNAIVKKFNLHHIGVHKFRHTYASILFEAGVNIQEVKELLGHSSIKTTMDIYTHVSKDKKAKSIEKLETFLSL